MSTLYQRTCFPVYRDSLMRRNVHRLNLSAFEIWIMVTSCFKLRNTWIHLSPLWRRIFYEVRGRDFSRLNFLAPSSLPSPSSFLFTLPLRFERRKCNAQFKWAKQASWHRFFSFYSPTTPTLHTRVHRGYMRVCLDWTIERRRSSAQLRNPFCESSPQSSLPLTFRRLRLAPALSSLTWSDVKWAA